MCICVIIGFAPMTWPTHPFTGLKAHNVTAQPEGRNKSAESNLQSTPRPCTVLPPLPVYEKSHHHCNRFDPLFIGHRLRVVLAAAGHLTMAPSDTSDRPIGPCPPPLR